jgi:hypothetical protein
MCLAPDVFCVTCPSNHDTFSVSPLTLVPYIIIWFVVIYPIAMSYLPLTTTFCGFSMPKSMAYEVWVASCILSQELEKYGLIEVWVKRGLNAVLVPITNENPGME